MDNVKAVSTRRIAPKRRFTVIGACSGSLQEHVIYQAIEAACPELQFQLLWSCENDQKKQRWIRDLQKKRLPPAASGDGTNTTASGDGTNRTASGDGTEAQQENEPCIFEDICDLHKGRAKCVVHNKKCPVTRGDIAIMCGSCKDISRQNPNSSKIKKKKLVFQQPETPGGSA